MIFIRSKYIKVLEPDNFENPYMLSGFNSSNFASSSSKPFVPSPYVAAEEA